jgi:Ser/Thr protein kinase RdoA (MazF antagonist)
MSTPRLLPAGDGADWIDLGPDGVWRLMTRVPGVAFDRAESPTQIQAAGELLGRFHATLDDLDHAWQGSRVGVHDTQRHLQTLRAACSDHPTHRLYDQVAPLAEALLAQAEALPRPPDGPAGRPRPVHGDPKLNNVLFEGPAPPASERARCFVDLDTVGLMPRWQELGDALRSWCNQAGEDDVEATFDSDAYAAAVAGYEAGYGGLQAADRDFLVHATRWISLELAARFAADALNETYFGFDERFGGRGEHNLLRARGQWSLCRAAGYAGLA